MAETKEQIGIAQFVVKIDGQELDTQAQQDILEVIVDSNRHLPDMFTLQFYDHDEKGEFTRIDGGTFDLGKQVEVVIGGKTLIKGEITSIEPDFRADGYVALVIRGYDKAHRLHRGRKSRVFANMTDSDIVSKVASEAGLSADADSTSPQHEHIWQNNQTDMEFLLERAERVGYQLYVEDSKLCFKKYKPEQGGPELEWGSNLLSFRPRAVAAHQTDKVIVRGWDPVKKQKVEGEASKASNTDNQGGITEDGGAAAKKAFSNSAEAVIVTHPVLSPDEAKKMAQSIFDEINGDFVQAEGIALGDPGIKAGKVITIVDVGERFSGTYVVSSATHIISAKKPYQTHFSIHGRTPDTLAHLLKGHNDSDTNRRLVNGVVVGVVTNNQDPEGLGRVKVKYPWLDDSLESHWAKLVTPGAGITRGVYFIPEVDDEVMIGFEHGDIDRPYIIGGVWNSSDNPPKSSDSIIADGKVNERIIQSRTGHIIILGDKDGEEQIVIRDKTGKNEIVIDSANNVMTLHIEGDYGLTAKQKIETTSDAETNITSKGDMTFKGQGVNITIDSGNKVTIKGAAGISIESSANMDIKATGQLNIKGATVSVKGDAMTEIKGGIVKIN